MNIKKTGRGDAKRGEEHRQTEKESKKSQAAPVGMSQPLQAKAIAHHNSMVVFGRDEPSPVILSIPLRRVCQED